MTSPPLHPPDTVSTARADNYHRVVASPSSIQLARERLRRSFEETKAVNRVDSVMASRNRFQARTGGSESVIVRARRWSQVAVARPKNFHLQHIRPITETLLSDVVAMLL